MDQGSSADILYWDAFERLLIDTNGLKTSKGSLVGFSEERVQLKGYITLKTTFRVEEQCKKIDVRYMDIDPSSYNIIIGKPSFN